MAAVSAIVLADALATPVNHTFIPLGPDQNGAWWFEDQSAGTATIGYNRISCSLTRVKNPGAGTSSNGDRMNRVKIAIHCPILETLGTNDAGVTPPPSVAYVSRAQVEFMLPERNSSQNRKDLRKYAQFLLANTQVVDMVESLQNVY